MYFYFKLLVVSIALSGLSIACDTHVSTSSLAVEKVTTEKS